ncbi:vigilin-like [Neocloeon triangulifer]|uniref:vigilin-like n=1 Tax=Neocloeon triangulifer TaxID=2078957 RepID=UPI00286ED0DB|nr:vigilin-like [Neocloeon triangulifer]
MDKKMMKFLDEYDEDDVDLVQSGQLAEVNCLIPHTMYGTLIGKGGSRLKSINRKFEVQVIFPADKRSEKVRIRGKKKENCEKAKQALLEQVPVKVHVPHKYHGSIIGKKGSNVRELNEKFRVRLNFPPPDQHLNFITISGAPACVSEAKEEIESQWKKMEDKQLRSFQLKVKVDPDFLGNLIGPLRPVILQIMRDHDVQIKFPKEGDAEKNIITITGYEEKAKAVKKDVLKIVSKLKKEQVSISSELHNELLGGKGEIDIQKVMEEFKVGMRLSESTTDPSLVTIIGAPYSLAQVKEYLLIEVFNTCPWLKKTPEMNEKDEQN